MSLNQVSLDQQVYLFEIDDVLTPKEDYLIQVYYLFGSFLEFNEGTPGAMEVAEYMKNTLASQGQKHVLRNTISHFSLKEQYAANFDRLQANAQLPLRLNLIPETEHFIAQLFQKNKKVAILTKGNPVEQLNKLKFMDWGTLETYKNLLRVYFIDELTFRSLDPLTFIAEDLGEDKSSIIFINKI